MTCSARLMTTGTGLGQERSVQPDRGADRLTSTLGDLLKALGEDPRNYVEPASQAHSEDIHSVHNIGFYSLGEGYVEPYFGKVHLAYIPDGRIATLSELTRTVEQLARQPRSQEHLTQLIVESLNESLGADGMLVVVEAERFSGSTHRTSPYISCVTSATRGAIEDRSIDLFRGLN